MVDSAKHISRSMNPWVLHLQKLGLELKCPLCLDLFSQPLLLPCNHIFCKTCIPIPTDLGQKCPVCKFPHTNGDAVQCLTSSTRNFTKRLSKEPFETTKGGRSSGRQAIVSAMASKLVKILPNHPVEHEIINSGSVQRYIRGEELEIPGKGTADNNGAPNLNLLPPSAQIRAGVLQECESLQIDMNHVEQSSPGSPPSFGDNKGSDNDIGDQGSDHIQSADYQANRSLMRSFDDETRRERYGSFASETEGFLRGCKRQKKLNYGLLEGCVESTDIIRPIAPQAKSSTTSDYELGKSVLGAKVPAGLDDLPASGTICGFCQSSRFSEDTGPILHYAKGNPVDGNEATHPDVIHVHKICIEWAPQVYYVGETVKNLKAEMARGAKLKCSCCGLKGAALGCYVKSCKRSYHVPCAKNTNCRWDHENFLILCPAHSSLKFPNEKSRKLVGKDHAKPSQITPLASSVTMSSHGEAKQFVLCGSALSSEEKFLLVKFASMIGATVSKFWNPNVTHLIAATDEKGACVRTLKILMAILSGTWIVNINWINACMENMRIVDEEPYEVILDNHGCCDGPKTGRLGALNNAPKLFNGLSFYFVGDFVLGYKKDLENLVVSAGGSILRGVENLAASSHEDQAAATRTLVVYNLDPPQGSKLGEEVSIIWQRLNEAGDLATKIGSQVVGHTWVLESIAAYRLQPFVK